MRARATADIESEKQRAIADLRAEVADLALAAAGRVVGETMTDERQRRLVDEFLAEPAGGGAGNSTDGDGQRDSAPRRYAEAAFQLAAATTRSRRWRRRTSTAAADVLGRPEVGTSSPTRRVPLDERLGVVQPLLASRDRAQSAATSSSSSSSAAGSSACPGSPPSSSRLLDEHRGVVQATRRARRR